MVMEVVHEDMGEGNLQCPDHPYKNSTPGGVCAFCLQEKLGKLVSSSFPLAIFPSSSPSSSPSFRSDSAAATTAAVSSLQVRRLVSSSATSHTVSYSNAPSNDCNYNGYYSRRSRLPFILTHRKKKKKDSAAMAASSDPAPIVFKRSKSTATPRRGSHYMDENYAEDYSPNKWGFWSFLYLSRNSNPTSKKSEKPSKDSNFPSATASSVSTAGSARERKTRDFIVEENESPDNQATFDRKVSRSRSVGCGSRSFSGDFFERISTGFGDCALRRVESQREGKSKISSSMHKNGGNNNGQVCIKERVRCAGIFSGFTISSSSSSSSYRASSSTEDNSNGKSNSTTPGSVRNLSHGRSKSWGWAFASPMKAFSKPSSGKRDSSANKNAVPNLAAIPSLLAQCVMKKKGLPKATDGDED